MRETHRAGFSVGPPWAALLPTGSGSHSLGGRTLLRAEPLLQVTKLKRQQIISMYELCLDRDEKNGNKMSNFYETSGNLHTGLSNDTKKS